MYIQDSVSKWECDQGGPVKKIFMYIRDSVSKWECDQGGPVKKIFLYIGVYSGQCI